MGDVASHQPKLSSSQGSTQSHNGELWKAVPTWAVAAGTGSAFALSPLQGSNLLPNGRRARHDTAAQAFLVTVPPPWAVLAGKPSGAPPGGPKAPLVQAQQHLLQRAQLPREEVAAPEAEEVGRVPQAVLLTRHRLAASSSLPARTARGASSRPCPSA